MTQKQFSLGFLFFVVVIGLIVFFTYKPDPDAVIPGVETPSPTPSVNTNSMDLSGQKSIDPQALNVPADQSMSQIQQQAKQQGSLTQGAPPAQNTAMNAASKNNKYSAPPPMTIDTNKKYSAIISTSKGDMTVELYAKDTPKTVNNFVFLAKDQFYNGIIFHRIIKDFMSQTGDPTGTGAGGPGYKFEDEPVTKSYTKGIVAMANAGPNTNGSQFFIMNQDYPLPKNYTIFGKVTKGLETVDAIAATPVTRSASGENSKPTEQVTINSITIQES